MRDLAAIVIINDLIEAGGHVAAYDPKASESAKAFYFNNNFEYYQIGVQGDK